MIEILCIRERCITLRARRGLCWKHYAEWKAAGEDQASALPKRKPGPRPKLATAAKARALAAYLDSDEPLPAVAARFGVSDRQLMRWRAAAGVPTRFNRQGRVAA